MAGERRREGGRKVGTGTRASLRTELLFNLAFLAAAALLLAIWTDNILELGVFAGPASTSWLVALVALDLLVFVALGRYLIDRLILRPLADTAAAADAIAGGDYQRRVRPGRTREMATLASAVNRLTDQLLRNQSLLSENIRSLDETNQRLVVAQQDLVQAEKLAGIGQLAAGVAHEIGNPLGALLGYASVLRRRGGDSELLDGVEREARRIDRIVRSLLDYARPGVAARESLDVNETIRNVMELLRGQGKLCELALELDLATDLPPIPAVAHSLEQIFFNLFLNAEAAMNGTGELSVSTAAALYRPEQPLPKRRADDPAGIDYSHLRRTGTSLDRLQPGTEVVRVTVADTGPGITQEHLAHVFDPFFTTKAPGEGTGLGLAIVASTVAELGGRVDVSSPPGGGAIFTLLLPAVQENTTAPP